MECVCAWNAVLSALNRLANSASSFNEGLDSMQNPAESTGSKGTLFFLLLLIFALIFYNNGEPNFCGASWHICVKIWQEDKPRRRRKADKQPIQWTKIPFTELFLFE